MNLISEVFISNAQKINGNDSFFFRFFKKFIYLWLCWVVIAVAGFSLRWLLLLHSMRSRRTGLVALWHGGSSGSRARNPVPCIGRWILNHWATREVLIQFLFNCKFCILSLIRSLLIGWNWF